MTQRSAIGSLIAIAAIVGGAALAFAYTAGWFSPNRLRPERYLAALQPPAGPALGHRRNHAKGICFTGVFSSNGAGSALSKAQLFTQGRYPVTGRFSLASADLAAADTSTRVRALAFRIVSPDGQEWRSGNISAPFFPVGTTDAFLDLLVSSGSKDPGAMPAFAARHPEIAAFGAWAKAAPWTGSYAEERYNGLNAFIFTDASGAGHPVRWSLLPKDQPVDVSADELAKRSPNFLEKEITERVSRGPVSWTMAVAMANQDDPIADPSKAWPDGRRTIEVGMLTVQQVEPEPDGPCREINFDPTVLPVGIRTSDDPFPAARSAVYAKSYDRRTAEASKYPATPAGAKP
jgi:catalase